MNTVTKSTTIGPRRSTRKRKKVKYKDDSDFEPSTSSSYDDSDEEYSQYSNVNDNNDESDYELDSSSIKKSKSQREKKKKIRTKLRCNECLNSRRKYDHEEGNKDIITMELLEEKHIEWISPDGKMKQCYNIGTLLKIACKDEKNKWLQPPHFRAPMDSILKAQVEKKFPGVIAKLESINEKREKKKRDIYDGILDDATYIDDSIMENYFERYGNMIENVKYNWMSDVGDMYVCPLCYSYLSDLLDIENKTSESDEELEDPLEILTHMGVEVGAVALALKQAEMKTHLSSVHGIPKKYLTKKAGCPDVLKRFTLRSSDGLIQQYCHSKKNQHHKSYYIGDSCLNRGRYNALYYTTLQKTENRFPELIYQKSIWEILGKENTKEAKEYCGEAGLTYFRSLISQWSTEESALDFNFIANDDSFDDEESNSSSSSSSSSNENSSTDDNEIIKNEDLHRSKQNNNNNGGSSDRSNRRSTRRSKRHYASSSAQHVYFTQKMQEQQEDADEIEWESQRYESLSRRRGLGIRLFEESDGDNDRNNNIQNHKKRNVAHVLASLKKHQEVLVFYRDEKGFGKWYDAKISLIGRRSVKVLYDVDNTEERIYVDSDKGFGGRIKVKPRVFGGKPSPRPSEMVVSKANSGRSEDDDGLEIFYDNEEEIVNKTAITTPASRIKRKRKRRIIIDSSNSSDDDAPLVNLSMMRKSSNAPQKLDKCQHKMEISSSEYATSITLADDATKIQMQPHGDISIRRRRKKMRLSIEDSDDDDDDAVVDDDSDYTYATDNEYSSSS